MRRVQTERPRHVYLSLRNPFPAIQEFATQVLPQITAPFVLISGSEDVTLPNQVDQRWRPFSDAEKDTIFSILHHEHLIHWFAENLDEKFGERVSGLPLGMVYPNSRVEDVTALPFGRKLCERHQRVLCGHRTREGPQWDIRREVTVRAETVWAAFSTVTKDEVNERDFLDLMRSHAFVLCVEGGGLDPSPKAWQCLEQGAIPIVRRTAATEPYQALPVAFVDSWEDDAISAKKLEQWRAEFSVWFDDPYYRHELRRRLSLDYWWKNVTAIAASQGKRLSGPAVESKNSDSY